MKIRGNMETEEPSSIHCPDQDNTIKNVSSVDVNLKRAIHRCKVCRKKFRNHDFYTAHVKLHKVTRRLSKFQRKVNKISKKDLVYQCRICGTKHIGFVQCFEHQRLHEQHSKYFDKLFTSNLVPENNRYHILNSDNQNEQPSEVIIATSEDVELLGNDTIAITNINETEPQINDEAADCQTSEGNPRDVIIGECC